MYKWSCLDCGHEVYTMDKTLPLEIKWDDGHRCKLQMLKMEES